MINAFAQKNPVSRHGSSPAILMYKSIFSAGTAMDVFIIRTLADLSGMAVLYAYHIQVKEIQMLFQNLRRFLKD